MSGAEPGPGGLVVVDKPAGLTSHDVVARVRRLAGTRKVGHAGTLDPMATGVLLVGVERTTRLLGHLAIEDKDLDGTAVALASARGLIRSEVGKQLGMRHTPSIEFIHDALPDTARHIDELLAQARESDAAVAAAAAGAAYAGEPDPYRKPSEAEPTDDE